ncbi:MAG: hypothetical protein WDN23_02015 [Edaphobacter sp.]
MLLLLLLLLPLPLPLPFSCHPSATREDLLLLLPLPLFLPLPFLLAVLEHLLFHRNIFKKWHFFSPKEPPPKTPQVTINSPQNHHPKKIPLFSNPSKKASKIAKIRSPATAKKIPEKTSN